MGILKGPKKTPIPPGGERTDLLNSGYDTTYRSSCSMQAERLDGQRDPAFADDPTLPPTTVAVTLLIVTVEP